MELTAPNNINKVLLHTCCAPCSSAIVECLIQNGIAPTIFYFNPNIYPHAEYLRRRDECVRYAQMLSIDFVEWDYDHSSWLSTYMGLKTNPNAGNAA